jgi:cytochrome c553
MKRWLLRIAMAVLALGLGGFLIAASGIIPITASSGHWQITAWLLHFSMLRSIATYSAAIEPPPLEEPRLVLQGAGHYETGCRWCHGSPAQRNPRIPQAMTPFPPYLPPLLTEWDAEDLFYIVKHGVKFTGMPAWPTQQRDDEVWAMVAFLRVFPNLTAEEYHQLVHGPDVRKETIAATPAMLPAQPAPDVVNTNCGRCHGIDGQGRGLGAFPKLAGQRPGYFIAALHAYARGERHSGVMQPIAAELSPEAIQELAHYYHRQLSSVEKRLEPTQTEMINRGQAIATRGIPQQRVPACMPCHDPNRTHRNPAYPDLAGQYAEYLVLQLELFKRQQRGGSAYAHLMRTVAAGLTPEQMRDVAAYFESLAR